MINNVVIVGRTCGDIEIKTFESGNKVGELTLAIGERRKNKEGEYVDHTEFIRCRMWGKTAELCESYVPKGTMIGFTGKFVTDSWEKDGQKHFKSYVAVRDMKFIPGGKSQKTEQDRINSIGNEAMADIPF